MGLAYRMHTKEDEPALIRLWSEHSGWDEVDADVWAYRFLRPPFGAASIVLATDTDTGQIVGQLALIPCLLSVDGREVKADRLFAVILTKSARGVAQAVRGLGHPAAAMYLWAVKVLRARGDGLIYVMPDQRLMRFLRRIPGLLSGSFPLWSLPLPLAAPLRLPAGYETVPLPAWDERVDRLWEAASGLYGCQMVRDSRALSWKMGTADYTVTAIERGGTLVGLVASQQKGDRQWLICDLLTVDAGEALRATMAAVTNVAHAASMAANPPTPIRKVAVLTTPVMEPTLRCLGFARDAYDFHVVVHVLDPALAKADLAPARWYLSATD